MREVYINVDDAYLSDDDWKGYVYPEEFFDEVFVIFGNRKYKDVTSASWFNEAKEVLDENDVDITVDSLLETLRKLYPNNEFESATIRGYCQGDWQDVIYKKSEINNPKETIEYLESFYFGSIVELFDTEENCVDYITNDEFWKAENNGTVKSVVRNTFGIPDDEDFKVFVSDGYKRVRNWKSID